MNNKKLVKLFPALAAALIATSASADNAPEFPGSGCRLSSPQAYDTGIDASSYGGTAFKNVSGTAQDIICPIPHNGFTNINYFHINMSTSGATCSVYARSEDGASLSRYAPVTVGRSGGAYLYNFGQSGFYYAVGVQSLAFLCTIPANATVYGYNYGER